MFWLGCRGSKKVGPLFDQIRLEGNDSRLGMKFAKIQELDVLELLIYQESRGWVGMGGGGIGFGQNGYGGSGGRF